MLWPFPPRYLTCPLTRLPMYVKSSLVNLSLKRKNENISMRFLIHFNFYVIFLQYATFELLPRFFVVILSRFGTIDERNCEKMELPFHLFQKSVPFLPNSATSSRENHAKTMHPQSSVP